MLVVLFHLGVPGFSGGFVGVDIFFVISGFLMTSAFFSYANAKEQLPFWRYYIDFCSRRLKRIAPALLFVVFVLLALGWLYLPSEDYRQLAIHSVFSLLFLSNIKYWKEAGYFDAESHEKLLLHTWSLSVEWQFYIIFPVLLIVVWRLFRGVNGVLLGLILMSVTSFLASLMTVWDYPVSNFFLSPFRFWEFFAGGIVFVLGRRRLAPGLSRVFEITGFSLIVASLFLYDSSSPWPGAGALFPVAGASLVILSARQTSFLTCLALFQWIGFRSYSLYLWHWPLIVVVVSLGLELESWLLFLSFVVSLILSDFTYRLIESKSKPKFVRFAPAFIVLLCFCSVVYIKEGMPERMTKNVTIASFEASNTGDFREECHTTKGDEQSWCEFGGDDTSIVIIGDSHAPALSGALVSALQNSDPDKGGLLSSYSSCPTALGVKGNKSDWQCDWFNKEIKSYIAVMDPAIPVVIINSGGLLKNIPDMKPDDRRYVWFQPGRTEPKLVIEDYKKSYIDTVCSFASERDVYLTRPVPHFNSSPPRVVALRLALGLSSDYAVSFEDYLERNRLTFIMQNEAAERCGVNIIPVEKVLCDPDYCYASKDGRPLYYDGNHLSEYGSNLLVDLVSQYIP